MADIDCQFQAILCPWHIHIGKYQPYSRSTFEYDTGFIRTTSSETGAPHWEAPVVVQPNVGSALVRAVALADTTAV